MLGLYFKEFHVLRGPSGCALPLSPSLLCASLIPHDPSPGPYKNHISWMSAAAPAFGGTHGAKGP